jgi:hypothetical protein
MPTRFQVEPGEELLVRANVSFRGSAAVSLRSTFALGSARMHRRAYEVWSVSAHAAHFPDVGPEMVLQLTNHRLAVRRASFWMGHPTEIGGDIALRDIAQVAVLRHGLVVGLAFAMRDGSIVEVEAMRSRRMRKLAHRLDDLLSAIRP